MARLSESHDWSLCQEEYVAEELTLSQVFILFYTQKILHILHEKGLWKALFLGNKIAVTMAVQTFLPFFSIMVI